VGLLQDLSTAVAAETQPMWGKVQVTILALARAELVVKVVAAVLGLSAQVAVQLQLAVVGRPVQVMKL
jgi:hypothetical protein